MLSILGGGESGTAAAILAKKNGWDVFLSDYGKILDNYKIELEENNILFEEGKHTTERILNSKLIIKSPGISDDVPIVKSIIEKQIPIISEIEFAYKYHNGKIIAITGSNGKTTTTSLIYHVIKSTNRKIGVGGNIGNAFARLVLENPNQDCVLELSSFQLDGIETFKPDIAILTNITPDHLDRYQHDISLYAKAKFRITKNQKEKEILILNASDQITNKTFKQLKVEAKIKWIKDKSTEDLLKVGDLAIIPKLLGKHNAFNIAMTVDALLSFGLSFDEIKTGIESFEALAHRLEPVASIDGVKYVNDSKATNVDAVFYALEAIKKPIVWIVGGVDKGNDYSTLLDLVSEKVKAIVILSKFPEKIQKTFSKVVDKIYHLEDVKEAITVSQSVSKKGTTVLLSPACASFDLFDNYIDRGEKFKEQVIRFKEKHGSSNTGSSES